ncbi:hypothetical protein Vi05172_g6636 [Venturia inaequalis]|nr:hypothetical protein Vi05172_g6636 [Venturia inaequalis]
MYAIDKTRQYTPPFLLPPHHPSVAASNPTHGGRFLQRSHGTTPRLPIGTRPRHEPKKILEVHAEQSLPFLTTATPQFVCGYQDSTPPLSMTLL